METACRIVLGNVLIVDGAVHLLDHLEILMDGVAGEGVVWHRRASHLERSRRERVDIGDTRVRTEREAEATAPGSEEELILRRQARISTRDAQDGRVGRHWANAAQIGRRQRGVELLICQIRAAEKLAAIRGGYDLVLRCPCEIRARRAIGVDNALQIKGSTPALSCL